MKIKRILIRLLVLLLVLLTLMFLFYRDYNYATVEYSELNGKWFYIKNAYTGEYLDVYNNARSE